MHRYLIFAIGLLVLVVLFAPSLDRLGTAGPGATSEGASSDEIGKPQIAAPGAGANAVAAPVNGSISIEREPGGQFHMLAEVNGHPVRFLIDTGADGVALTEADAAAAGITVDPTAYTPVANTASGTGYGARVQLDRMEIAGQDVSGVDAVVLRGLGASLMGQSVLRRFGSVTITGDHMVIGK